MFVPDDQLVGALHNGWAVANTTLAHERGTTFPFKEQVVHEVLPRRALRNWPPSAGKLDDVDGGRRAGRVRSSSCGCCGCTTGARSPAWRTAIEPGPESSVTKLHWTDMTQTLSDAALLVLGDAAPLWAGAAGNPDGGQVAAPVAVVQGGDHRRRDLGDPAHDHRRTHPRPAPLNVRDAASGRRTMKVVVLPWRQWTSISRRTR